MEYKRIIPCLDVRNGKLTKGVQFQGNIDIGDPVEVARRYSEEGADEIVFYDITASVEDRGTFLDIARQVAQSVSVPFCIGGGISSLADMQAAIDAGAQKISINTAAVLHPGLIEEGAVSLGSHAVAVAMDVKRVGPSAKAPSGYEVVIKGGKQHMGMDALWWAKRCQELGAGELCVNSIDADGMKTGYDLELTAQIADSVSIPVIASGGAGAPEHLYEALTRGRASAALVASIVHYGEYTIPELKRYLAERNCPVRL